MKKKLGALTVLLLIFGFRGWAAAVPYTWVDTIDLNPDRYISCFDSYSYEHNITDNTPVAFNPGEDLIYSYNLKISLYDDKYDPWYALCELAFVNQPGVLGDGFYNFSYNNETFGWSLSGIVELNTYGLLNITISSVLGDFYFDKSVLTACGDNATNTTAPVPEPATMFLLGTGLVGIAAVSRKKYPKK